MIFNKVFQKKSQEFLAVNVFPRSCNLALFEIADDKLDVSNSQFFSFAPGESFTEVVKGFVGKVGLRNHLKVVFGLPSFWIEGEQVKPEFEKTLLTASEELKLTPTAFVSSTAAVGFYKYQKDKTLQIFYILAFFDKKILAEKFENGEVVKSATYDFENFDSLPNFEIFDKIPQKVFVYLQDADFEKVTSAIGKYFGDSDNSALEILPIEVSDFAQSLAFATAFDLGKLPQTAEIEQLAGKPGIPTQAPTSEEFGFLAEKDVGEIDELRAIEVSKGIKPAKFFAKLPSLLSRLPPGLAKLKTRKDKFLVAVGLLILAGLFGVFWFLPTATIELFVKSSPFSQDFDIKAQSSAAEIDASNLIIPAQILESSKEGSKRTLTTGKKKTGEKAQGTVTVFNKTTTPKTFSTGTVIVGPQNLKFVFVEQVTVASRSASLEGITFGKNKVGVEAVDFGEASNLPKNTDLTLLDFDSSLYSAYSEEGFTGGVSKDINVVTEDDKQRLSQELVKELREQAKGELTQKAAGRVLDEAAIVEKPQKLSFDKEIGDEANILQLAAQMAFQATTYSAADVENLVTSQLKTDLAAGSKNWQNSKIETQVLKVEGDGTLRLKVGFGADLIPEFATHEILGAISGKSVDFAKNYLLNIKDVENVNIKLSPKMPGFLGSLPRLQSRIKIEVKAQKE